MKSIFTTRVFWGAFFGLLTAITPAVSRLIKGEGNKVDNAQVIVLAVAAAGLSVVGRVNASQPAYTPNWLPGPNKEDK